MKKKHGNRVWTYYTLKKTLRIMRIVLFLLLISVFQTIASVGYSQNAKITLKSEALSLVDVLRGIEDQTEYRFIFDKSQIDLDKKVRVNFDEATVKKVLEELFVNRCVSYQMVGNQIILGNSVSDILQQSKAISGKVTDSSGAPLPGVTVVVKGTTNGTITDMDGKYSLSKIHGDATLVFSFVGMKTQEIALENKTLINVTMEEDAIGIEEVVAIGYGTMKKINITGAVDAVSQEVLKDRPSANIGALLQGVSPNLNISVTKFGGEPGAGNSFNIRGVGSLSGSEAPLILVDGVEMNINNLDPENIQSVSILKDAASSAIYGARAPFGVILVTTKNGTKNKGISISYSNNIASASPINLPQWQSSLRYVTAFNQSLQNSGQPNKFSAEQIDRITRYIAGTYPYEYDPDNPPPSLWAGRHQGNANYEWFDEYFKDYTINQKHNVSVSGGDEHTQFYLSTGFYDQGGLYNWADEFYKRYNILSNIKTQVTSWMNLNVNVKYANTKSQHPNYSKSSDSGRNFIISEMIKFYPVTPFYNVNGTINNPYVAQIMRGGNENASENDLSFTLGTEIEPIKGWKTNINYNFNYTGYRHSWLDKAVWVEIPTGAIVNKGADPEAYYSRFGEDTYKSIHAYTSYDQTIGNHYVKGMVGYERESRYYSSLDASKNQLISNLVPSISTALGISNVGDSMGHWGTEAFFGRLNYNYQEKYLLEINGRYDGSSKFSKDFRWGFFPSASVGYIVSKESFWEPLQGIINNLKIRGSYGSLGNQNVSNYLYLSTVPIKTNLNCVLENVRPLYSGVPDIISGSLTWETINTLNLGIDVNFLNNRLGIVADWYQRNTSDMFGPAMILPNSLGASPPQENNASLVTKGWEVSIDWKDRINSDLNYSLKFTLADSRSHVTKYLNTTGLIDNYYEGRELGEIWGYETAGIIQTADEVIADQSYIYSNWGPGDIKYTDLNGDGKIDDGKRTLDDHGDIKVIGNMLPRYSIGFSSMVKWRNFDFTMIWQGVLKRNMLPGRWDNMAWGIGTQGNSGGAFYQGHDDYWRPADETNLLGPNTDAYYAKPYVTAETYKNQRDQSRYLISGGYFRLKNAQVSYMVPAKLTSKIKVKTLKVYVSGENLLTFSKIPPFLDPETAFESLGYSTSRMLGAIYPNSKSISVGLNITF